MVEAGLLLTRVLPAKNSCVLRAWIFACERVLLLHAATRAYLLRARLGVAMSVITQESTSGESYAQVQEVLVCWLRWTLTHEGLT